jgi:2-methylaconitate cis-trans-isomerase PrpF
MTAPLRAEGADARAAAPRLGLYRSGESYVLVAREADLPPQANERDRVILKTWRTLAIPDPPHESLPGKVLLLGDSDRRGTRLRARFGQILPGDLAIEWNGRCGNALAAAAVHLAVSRGLQPNRFLRVVFVEGTGNLRTHATVFVEHRDGFQVRLEFYRPICAMTGSLVPHTGAWHHIELEGSWCEGFLLDAGNPYVLVRAPDVGVQDVLRFREAPLLRATLQRIRMHACAAFGLTSSRVFPKIALVAAQPAQTTPTVASVMLSLPDHWHPSYALTGLLTLAVAANMHGSPVQALLGTRCWTRSLRVVSPSRVFDVEIGPMRTDGRFDIPAWVSIVQTVQRQGSVVARRESLT